MSRQAALTPDGVSVVERVRRGMPGLTKTERLVARTLIAGYPVAGLGTVADLAVASSTSAATVVRLVQKLGFEGYAQFQSALRGELDSRRSGPADRLEHGDPSWARPGTLGRAASAAMRTVGTVPDTVVDSEFEAAVALLCDTARPVKLVGGRITGLIAAYLQHHLSRARRHVNNFPSDARERHAALLDVGRRDVLVVMDVRRYDSEIGGIADAAHDRGASVLLLTDVFMSPIATIAQVVLPVRVDAPSPFDTTVALLVVVEALATAAIARLGDSAARRMLEWDGLADAGLGG